MRAAPAVDYPVAVAGLWFDALAVLLAWSAVAPLGLILGHALGRSEPVWIGLLLATLAAGLWSWRRRARVRADTGLRWDGQAWSLRALTPAAATGPAASGGSCAVMIDLGDWLLLRWSGAGGQRWLPLTRTDAPPSWHALRVALRWPPLASDPAMGTDVAA